MLEQFGEVELFLKNNNDVGQAIYSLQAFRYLGQLQAKVLLQIELAVVGVFCESDLQLERYWNSSSEMLRRDTEDKKCYPY